MLRKIKDVRIARTYIHLAAAYLDAYGVEYLAQFVTPGKAQCVVKLTHKRIGVKLDLHRAINRRRQRELIGFLVGNLHLATEIAHHHCRAVRKLNLHSLVLYARQQLGKRFRLDTERECTVTAHHLHLGSHLGFDVR